MSPLSRSREVAAVDSNSRRSLSDHCTFSFCRLATDASADARGPRKSWLTALSSAVRMRSDSSISFAASALVARISLSQIKSNCEASASRILESLESSGRPSPAILRVSFIRQVKLLVAGSSDTPISPMAARLFLFDSYSKRNELNPRAFLV